MSSEPKTTSSTLGPERGFCEGFKAGVEGVEVMEATSGAIGFGDDDARRGAQELVGLRAESLDGASRMGVSATRGHVLGPRSGTSGFGYLGSFENQEYMPPATRQS
jgi:hypothetical protein